MMAIKCPHFDADPAAAAIGPRHIADLPGPRALPLVGSLLQVTRGRMHQTLEAWAIEFGPFFRVKLGPRTLLVVADREAVKTVLLDRPHGFRRSRHMESIGLEMGLTPGVFAANGEVWRQQRRLVMAALDGAHVRAYFPALLAITQRLRGRWLRAANTTTAIELQSDLMRFTVDAIAGFALGTDINTLETDDQLLPQHLERISRAMFKRMLSLIPLWRYLRLPSDRQLERSVAATNSAITQFIAAARQRLASDAARHSHPPNLLEAMIVAAEEGDGTITDREIAGNALTMMVAGEDTTANTLAWMIYFLQRHPDALHRAQAEVRDRAADSARFTPEQIASLDFLEACTQETMRLKPAAPIQVAESLRDSVIAGIRVPAGTTLLCLMRSDSLSARHFLNPEAFAPERWLMGSGPSQISSAARRVSMPFGAGPRICPGRNLALLEIKFAMAMLLAHFEIAEVTPCGVGAAMERMSFTMMPVRLRMRLRARAPVG
jgi:cytochrome P450